jgi:STE24 endopeptidase
MSSISSGIMLYLLFQFVDSTSLAAAVGIKKSAYHGSILAFGILFGPLSFLIATIANIFSRKNEYEADDYAKKTSAGKNLAKALKKFSIEHLSNLTPHKLYVFFHYTHPPTIDRIQRLEK